VESNKHTQNHNPAHDIPAPVEGGLAIYPAPFVTPSDAPGRFDPYAVTGDRWLYEASAGDSEFLFRELAGENYDRVHGGDIRPSDFDEVRARHRQYVTDYERGTGQEP
jgi:hypothetical protein